MGQPRPAPSHQIDYLRPAAVKVGVLSARYGRTAPKFHLDLDCGRFHRAEDAVEEALLLWEERERNRAEFLATLDDAKASLARGEGRIITQQSMRDLAGEVKQRGRDRLASEQPPVR